MTIIDFLIALVVLCVIGVIVYLIKHHPKPSLAEATAVSQLKAHVSGAVVDLQDIVREEVSRVPELTSKAVQDLTAERDALLKRAQNAEADLAAQAKAFAEQLSNVASRVTAAIQNSPELPKL